jgi:transcriptional regulator with AAA-type ATPase domain
MAHLQFREGDRLLFMHQLQPGRTMIGRSDRCDVALPSDSVSRTHCILERRTEGWWIQDRSRHGTMVNGETVRRSLLADGDDLVLGIYTARFSLGATEDLTHSAPTATRPPPMPAVHEELVDVTDNEIALSRAAIRFTRGPLEGRTILLLQPRTTIGGPGAQVELDADMPRNAGYIRVIRSRVMVEPSGAAMFLAGTRVRDVTPALPGEEVRIGDHAFVVDVLTDSLPVREREAFGDMVGTTPVIRQVFGLLTRMAAHDAHVLLTGASGTGKELAARGLHDCGTRHDGPFIAVNCAGIPETLFESELFGHEKGSFTGATQRQDGAFHRANGGTLFLDEIGELKPDAQAKLLRALELGEVRRVGSSSPEYPDVRIVAATNRDLGQMVSEGLFRSDLLFRLTVLVVRLPALARRLEDVPLLATTLLARTHPGVHMSEAALEALMTYDWPGNVRELKNVLTRAYVMGGNPIEPEHLSFNPWAFEDEPPAIPGRNLIDEQEKTALIRALRRHAGNRTKAAQELGIPRSSLLYKMKRLGVSVARR